MTTISVMNNSEHRVGCMFRPKSGQVRVTRVVFPPGVSEVEREKLDACLALPFFQKQVEAGVISFDNDGQPRKRGSRPKSAKAKAPEPVDLGEADDAIQELGEIE